MNVMNPVRKWIILCIFEMYIRPMPGLLSLQLSYICLLSSVKSWVFSELFTHNFNLQQRASSIVSSVWDGSSQTFCLPVKICRLIIIILG
jgi:hypothetical protein